ncbi:uncharacterized protein LOC134290608 [Aedes albopictus]|uniref:Endonuclease n=1 Tax=Aedes albopictus TaxID=7160 RepID=A0ABM1YX85_AEDAL
MAENNGSQMQRNCVFCSKPDEHDDMVACDSCQLWHHYSCADVDASVKDRDWRCTNCVMDRTGAKPKGTAIPSDNLAVPVKKSGAKSSAGSKTSRRSKKGIGEQSVTSSARMRLELELRAVEEQQKIREEELAAEKELKELERKLEEELREKELAIEVKRIAEAKAALTKRISEEREFKMKQMEIRRRSEEEKAKLIRQASEYGSSRGSLIGTDADSKDKVEDWLKKSTQQTAGLLRESTSAVDPSRGQTQTLVSQVEKGQQAHSDAFENRHFIDELVRQNVGGVSGDQVHSDGRNLKLLVGGIDRISAWEDRQRVRVREQIESDGQQNFGLGAGNTNEVLTSGFGGTRQHDNPAHSAEDPSSGLRRLRNDGVATGHLGAGTSGRREQPVPRSNESITQASCKDDHYLDGPTGRQLAARQVMGKDLPIFAGNPEEWPIWISNFRRSTSTCGFSDDENLIRLQRCLKGSALEAVRSRLLCPASVPHVIRTLEMRYGRPETLIRSMTERVRRLPSLKIHDLEAVIEFGLVVDNLVQHLKNAGQQAHLANPALLHDLVGKLPVDYRLKWSAYKSIQFNVDLDTFGQFMSTLVELAYDVADDFSVNEKQRQKPKERIFVQTHTEAVSPVNVAGSRNSWKPCAICKAEGHRVGECSLFKSMDVSGRLKAVQQSGICRSCLNFHGKWPCKTAKECGINDCRLKHHSLLHPPVTVHAAVSTSHSNESMASGGPLFRIIPVTLYGKDCEMNVYAFVDEGSKITLLEDTVADQLGITGPTEPLNLQWTGNIKRSEPHSRRISTQISGRGSPKQFELTNARTVGGLLLPSQTVNYEEMCDRYPHLRGLPIQSYEKVSPKLLIGLDNLKLTVPLKIREGRWVEPIAAKSRIGWSIYGCAITPASTVVCGLHFGGWTNQEQELNQLVRDYITLDNTGVTHPTALLESEEDKRSKMLLETTTRRVGGAFETGLLWKSDDVRLPCSYNMAYRRMCSLERRLKNDSVLFERVRQQLRDYEVKQYARKATHKELTTTSPDQCWYLPLGIVVNPKKPNKLRIIWDAAATVNGVSLNSVLLKGPDFLASLPAVIGNFRLYRYALTGDIKEMFHRFFIRPEDRQFQRFLFREQPEQEPITYVMDVAVFGAACSPSSAQYIKNLNAKDFEAVYPRAAEAIVRRHYVDDYLDSFGTVEEAVKIGRQVKSIHAEGGFELRNFLSNDPTIAARVGDTAQEAEKSICVEKDERIESVLGMKWIPGSDAFTFTVSLRDNLRHVLDELHVPTKREVLRTVMSFFDPMGLISYFLIHGRILMQDIWATGIDWDDVISEKVWTQWKKWIELIPQLGTLRIPRCYITAATESSYSKLQVHVFVDASQSAYACVAFFRVETPNGPEVSLVAAKSKVAPLKMLTIPRLELQAAVLGSRLLNSVIAMHALHVTKRVLWSDSNTVLAWIRSDQRRYHQFVGFRIGEILSTTEVNEWRKVPTGQNVADDATKWGSGPNISSNSRWFNGPEFLRQPEVFWPGGNEQVEPTEEELIVCNNVHDIELPSIVDIARFSKWEKLHRTTAYVHRFVQNLQRSRRNEERLLGSLTRDELVLAEQWLWKLAQTHTFSEEIQLLEKTRGKPEGIHKALQKSSALYKMWPFLDEAGVLRKRGRLGNAEWMSYQTKFPVILPRQHHITFLLVDYCHRRFRHCNRETIVNEMRQLYEIPRLRSVVFNVAVECMTCKIRRATPRPPPMAPLPKVRVTPYVRPFTFVGVDYFGPVMVKVGRSIVKRWIGLFTCLTVRAVHLEVVHSLSKESCVMAVRRFISRRGAPAEIFSDNGTNFVGASNQLKQEIEQLDEHLASTFTNTTTRWSFNPPGAPHMGGAWERMVRSVKVAIGDLLNAQRRPDDEVLETVMVEAEAMINSRPLTYIPLESADEESLTPNHFILGSSSGVKQMPVMPTDYQATLRSGWKLAQHLSDILWRRWIMEYLPVISRRSKWFDEVKEVEVGDLVLIVDGAMRNQWIRGRVDKVVAGQDGKVRQVWVRTGSGVLRRPVVKVAVLDVVDSGKPEVSHNGLRVGECDDEYPSASYHQE